MFKVEYEKKEKYKRGNGIFQLLKRRRGKKDKVGNLAEKGKIGKLEKKNLEKRLRKSEKYI